MSKDNKRFLKYLGIILLAELLVYNLPHDSYSIIEYIIRPIKIGKGTLYLSGLVPLILFIISIRGIFKLKRFEGKSKILVFLLVVVIIIPLMKWSINFTRTNYYWIMRDGLKAVDIEDSDISLGFSGGEMSMSFDLELIDYSRGHNEFKVRVYLPETLRSYIGQDSCELEGYYRTHGNRNTISINEEITLELDDPNMADRIMESDWYEEEVIYELYNEEEVVRIVHHGGPF